MDTWDARGPGGRAEQRLARIGPRHCPLPTPAPFALVLDPSYLAPRIARRTLGRWLLELSCPTQFVEDVKLVVDELVTNVVVHARTPVRVLASIDDGRLRHEVHDGSPAPLVVDPRPGTSGFGLRLVGVLADDWGWEPVPGGKYVWTEIRFADPAGG